MGQALAPNEGGRPIDLLGENPQNGADAGLPRRAKSKEIGLADQAGLRAKRDGLDDVATAADASVDQDLGPACYRIDDSRQNTNGARGAIELAATAVRDDDPVTPEL